MTLELPDLPYSHDALENNGMCKETMEFHHDLHHKAYVDNGNKLLAGSEFEGKDIEAIITSSFNKESKENGELYGSIKPKEICNLIKSVSKADVNPSQIILKEDLNKISN